ncbi:MAG: hypothetical protein OXH36_04420 [Bdellovibrionales bacterium]|nr:hypothetical protein [Bdellovibrionales bacterium]
MFIRRVPFLILCVCSGLMQAQSFSVGFFSKSSARKIWSGKEFRRLTWEELREAIIEYNERASEGEKITSVTYVKGKLYKRIPGAPSHPEIFYPDFKERGGWPALVGKTCPTAFVS